MEDWGTIVEAGRSIIASSRLGNADDDRLGVADEKFALGDLVVSAGPMDDTELGLLAKEIGHGLKTGQLKSYREVAEAWPADRRVAASWTTHRTLAKQPNRFDLIKPGMTLRAAQVAAGRRASDDAHPDRWSLSRRATFVIAQLQDPELNKTVRAEVEGQRHARAVRKAALVVEEEVSAAYREARRELRDKYNAQGPEAAILKAIFQLREGAEFVRAVGRAAVEENSWLPEHRKPDVVAAVRDLAIIASDTLAAIGVHDRSLISDALDALSERLSRITHPRVESGFSGTVIDMAQFADDAYCDDK